MNITFFVKNLRMSEIFLNFAQDLNERIMYYQNNRKYSKHINKNDKTEPLGVEYSTFVPFEDNKRISFSSKALLFDYIQDVLRCCPELDWKDFPMYKTINQRLIS